MNQSAPRCTQLPRPYSQCRLRARAMQPLLAWATYTLPAELHSQLIPIDEYLQACVKCTAA